MGDADDDGGASGGSMLSVAIPDLLEWDKKELLAREREMLGLYVSDHPLFGLEHVLTSAADCSVAALLTDESRQDGSMVTVAGLITGLQRKMTKQGKQWAIATVEDLGGAVEVLFFPSSYEQFAHLLAPDAVVVVKGRLSRRDDVPSLHAQDLTIPDTSVAADGPVVITLPEQRCTEPVADRLRGVLQDHRGQTLVHLRLVTTDKQVTVCLEDALRVTPSPSLFGDLKALLGAQLPGVSRWSVVLPVLLPVVLGVVVGLGWWLLAPTAAVVQLQGGTLLASREPELAASQDGWLVVLGAVAGLGSGVVAAVRAGAVPWRRSLLVVAGSALGSVLALGVGSLLGPASVAAQLAAGATPAEGLVSPLRAHSTGVLLVWPAVAALVMTAGHLAAGWSASSRRPPAADDGSLS